MSRQHLNSSAAPERHRFMPVSHTLLFGLLVLGALTLVFTELKLGNQLLASRQPDALSLAYLNVWLRAAPDDDQARLLLARQQAQAGQPDAASDTLAPLLSRHTSRPQITLLQLQILEQRYWQAASGSPQRAGIRTRLTAKLQQLNSHQYSANQLIQLATLSAKLGDEKLALAFLKQRWQLGQGYSSADDKLASILVGQGDYQAAASIHFHHMAQVASLKQKRKHYIAGLKALQSGNLMAIAMQAAKQHGQPLADDPKTLRFLIHLALAANQPQQAALYAARLLRQNTEETP